MLPRNGARFRGHRRRTSDDTRRRFPVKGAPRCGRPWAALDLPAPGGSAEGNGGEEKAPPLFAACPPCLGRQGCAGSRPACGPPLRPRGLAGGEGLNGGAVVLTG